MRRSPLLLPALLAWAVLPAPIASAELPVEPIGVVEKLPDALGPHWVWASDPLLRRIALLDLDDGEMLGMINGGWGITAGQFARTRPEVYVPETHYSRGSRGERTDVVTFYAAGELAPVAEVVIPPRRAINALPSANAALSADDRFLAVFNMEPRTSLSIVDTVERRFAGEIDTPGCALVYPAGARRFAMLCGDGSLMLVTLDERGAKQSLERSERFFDPLGDPVTEKAVPWKRRWIFVSFEGRLHTVDFSGEAARFEEPWSLLSESERAGAWRVGGSQHLALHAPTGRLYSLMHRGGEDTHKDPGTELWVYDLARRERITRIPLRSPGFTFMGVPLVFGESWPWPFGGLHGWLIDTFAAGLGSGMIAVTQDERPLLIAAANYSGSMAVYDALSGEFLRRVNSGNLATVALQAPWNGEPAR